MKTIGLIGGLTWESSIEYYRILNELVKERLGGLHSCKCIMYSVDFDEIAILQHKEDWDGLSTEMVRAAKIVERAGADFVLICTNTMHKVAEDVERHINIPLLHIADITAKEIKLQGLSQVGLLGTRFTMEQNFYKDRLSRHGIKVLVPEKHDRDIIHSIIYNELAVGNISDSSREKCKTIIKGIEVQGGNGVALGCTELPLLISQADISIPLFNTMYLHARAAVDSALGD